MMITWRWGRKATFAAYSAKSSMTMAELINLHRNCKVFMERNAVVMAATPVRQLTDRAPAIMQMLWAATRHSAAKLDFRRSEAPQSPLCEG